MNREMRRAQSKADKKQEEARDRLRAERILKRERLKQRRSERRKRPVSSVSSPKERKALPGRWSNIFAIMVIVFLVLQALIPSSSDQNPTFSFVVNILYYFMFGYFVYLWLSRRQVKQVLYYTIGSGTFLTLLLLGLQFVIPGISPEFRLLVFAIPAVVFGAFMGQLMFNRAP